MKPRYNMGCGINIMAFYTNVDKFDGPGVDLVADLETFPWPIPDGIAEEVVFNHSLEHMGQQGNVFCRIMQELYRICLPDAKIIINVPHPRHDDFINDPTHVRPITPEMLSLFSKANCLEWEKTRAANSRLALYYGVDFEVEHCMVVVEESWLATIKASGWNDEQSAFAIRSYNNVVKELKIRMKVIKP